MQVFLACGIFITALIFRIYGILNNLPFWVDEFSSGTQARLILDHGLRVFTDKSLLFEFQNITTHFLIAGSFMIFGQHEWAARLPMVIIGSLVPVAVYFLTKTLTNKATALVAAILITFSYFEIVWSRQARGYVLLQLLIIVTIYFYHTYLRTRHHSIKTYAGFALLILAGFLTHFLYLIVIAAISIDYIWLYRNKLTKILRSPLIYVALAGFALLLYKLGGINAIETFKSAKFFSANNLGYYHSFLWREYGLFTFLSLIGWVSLYFKKNGQVGYILLYSIAHLVFVTFFFGHHMSKYLLPMFPILLIGAAIGIVTLSDSISASFNNQFLKKSLPIVLVIFIVLSGHKFVNHPKSYYSINHDFREISNIDYNEVYSIIREHIDQHPAVIETWPGRLQWYLGNGYQNGYLYRWENEEGVANGHIKKTEFYVENGEKRVSKQFGFVGNTGDLEKIIKKNKVGFIFIDDSSLPQDVIQYAEKNLKKELYLDHYPLDDNPYSIWPATLYSWGVQ